MITKYQIDFIYKKLYDATMDYQAVVIDEIRAKTLLDQTIGQGILEGTIVGSNEGKRKASARNILPALHESYDKAKKESMSMKHCLTLAQIEVERVKMLMRLREVIAIEEVEDGNS